MAKCYTARLLNNTEPIPIFSFGDQKQSYKPSMGLPIGEYYIDCKLRMADGNLVHRHGWYPRVSIRYCLDRGYITIGNITHIMKASRYLRADIFSAWAMTVMKRFPGSYKHVLNHFVGWLGIQFFKHTEGCITDNFETAVGTSLQYDDDSVKWNKIGSQYFIQRKTSARQYTGHVFMHRHILASNFIELDKMYRKVTISGSVSHQIVGWNTDSMKLSIERELIQGVKAKSDCKPGDFYVEKRCYVRGRSMHNIAKEFTETEHEPTQWTNVKSETSCLILGMGGTGKTRQLVEEIEQAQHADKKFAVLTYTCASCHNVKCRCSVNAQIMTFDQFFFRENSNRSCVEKAAKLDIIFVDEFSMAPKRFFFILFQAKQQNSNLIIRIFGDHDQCTPMEDDWIDYMDSQMFRSLVNHNRHVLPYEEGSSRYDKELYKALVHLLDTGKLHPSLQQHRLRDDTVMSMCMSNTRTRSRVNEDEREKWIAAATGRIFTVQGEQYAAGMPIVSVVNLKSQGILNSHKLTFIEADETTVTLCRDKQAYKLSINVFAKEGNFRLGFCDSVFRNQGYTLREPYNIYDVRLMCLQDIYTALSRFTAACHIGFDASQLEDHVFKRKRPSEKQRLVELEKPKLIDAQIYRIFDSDGNQYIGYTTGTLEKRFNEHKTDPREPSSMKTWLVTTTTDIELVCQLQCLDLAEVKAIEATFIGIVPPEKSKNTHHKQRRMQLNLDKRCKLTTEEPQRRNKQPQPSVSNDKKCKRWKVQQRGFKPKYFGYGKPNAEQQARAWRFEVPRG
jgi:hypothetical protein